MRIKSNYGTVVKFWGFHISFLSAKCGCSSFKLLVGPLGYSKNHNCSKHAEETGSINSPVVIYPLATFGRTRLTFVRVPRSYALGFIHSFSAGISENSLQIGSVCLVLQRVKPPSTDELLRMLKRIAAEATPLGSKGVIPIDDKRIEEKIKSMPLKAN